MIDVKKFTMTAADEAKRLKKKFASNYSGLQHQSIIYPIILFARIVIDRKIVSAYYHLTIVDS